MLFRANHIKEHTIQAEDREVGRISDLCFDSRSWTIRYVLVESGERLSGRTVFLSPVALGQPQAEGAVIPASVSRAEIDRGPEIEQGVGLSRGDELKLVAHFGWPAYWADAPGLSGIPPAQQPAPVGNGQESAEDIAVACCLSDLADMRARARDAEVGSVVDGILSTEDWVIRHLILQLPDADTGVVVPPDWVAETDWERGELTFGLNASSIKASPAPTSTAAASRSGRAAFRGP